MENINEKSTIIVCGISSSGLVAKLVNELLLSQNAIWLQDVILTVRNDFHNGENTRRIFVKNKLES